MSIAEMRSRIHHFSDKQCGTGAAEAEIIAAESRLGTRFPKSYRAFLKEYGWARFAFDEIYGVGVQTPAHIDLVRNTVAEREEMGPPMPLHLIPVMNDGSGNHFCLDTSQMSDGECPIVFWDHEQGASQVPELVSMSFDRWLVELILARM